MLCTCLCNLERFYISKKKPDQTMSDRVILVSDRIELSISGINPAALPTLLTHRCKSNHFPCPRYALNPLPRYFLCRPSFLRAFLRYCPPLACLVAIYVSVFVKVFQFSQYPFRDQPFLDCSKVLDYAYGLTNKYRSISQCSYPIERHLYRCFFTERF